MHQSTLDTYRARAESALRHLLPGATETPARLHEAMRYAALDGGKRVRAALVYATGEALGAAPERLDAPACAIELIHAYSLVHDDMPCMDNDSLRRGKPTCHVAFGEANALLVGDALQTLAFEILATAASLNGDTRARMVQALAMASGSRGMAGGQAIDLASVGHSLTAEQLQDMHVRKTGALIACAIRLGVLAAGAQGTPAGDALEKFGEHIGLAFQVADDILDVEGDAGTLGKSAGKDAASGKPTYVSLLGLEKARAKARELHAQALECLQVLGDNGRVLSDLAGFIIERKQ